MLMVCLWQHLQLFQLWLQLHCAKLCRNDDHERQKVRPALEKTLKDLGLDYLDLFLVRHAASCQHIQQCLSTALSTIRRMAAIKSKNAHPHHDCENLQVHWPFTDQNTKELTPPYRDTWEEMEKLVETVSIDGRPKPSCLHAVLFTRLLYIVQRHVTLKYCATTCHA